MEIENSNKAYQIIIAGILVIAVLSICVAFALGFGGLLKFKMDNANQYISVFPLNSKDDLSSNAGNIEIVSVPEKGVFGPYDTEVGKMEIIDQVLPLTPLPLKITNEYLEDYWILVGTSGGYEWVDGYIKVMQAKSDEIWDIVGYINISLSETQVAIPHGWTYFNLTFSVVGNHPITLDSNHPPVSALGDFKIWGAPDNLGKWVTLKVMTTWKGCPKPEQEFMVILSQKIMFPESPIPDLTFLSPVEYNNCLRNL